MVNKSNTHGYIGATPTQLVTNTGVHSVGDALELLSIGNWGGSLELIEEQTASADSSVDFINLENNPYDVYMVQVLNLTTSANSQSFLRVSNDNGSTFEAGATYQVAQQVLTTGGTAIQNTGTTKNQMNLSMYTDTSTNSSSSGYIYLYNFLNSSKYSFITCQSFSKYSTDRMGFGGAIYPTAETHNAFQIAPSAGTISGNFKLYGVKQL